MEEAEMAVQAGAAAHGISSSAWKPLKRERHYLHFTSRSNLASMVTKIFKTHAL
jgi:hypothetical protein